MTEIIEAWAVYNRYEYIAPLWFCFTNTPGNRWKTPQQIIQACNQEMRAL